MLTPYRKKKKIQAIFKEVRVLGRVKILYKRVAGENDVLLVTRKMAS